jgi:hypothetical protein
MVIGSLFVRIIGSLRTAPQHQTQCVPRWGRRFRLPFLFLCAVIAAAAAFGAVDGTVTNKTVNKPQAGATVTLYKLGGAGMEAVESVKSDASGKFVIDKEAKGPHVIQTAYDGVVYNHMLPPGQPQSGINLEVFNAIKTPGAAKIKQHMILVEPLGTELQVRESYFYENPGTTTWNDPNGGTLRFFVPQDTRGNVEVMATAPQGMPIRRPADKAAEAGVMKVDFPIKPGESRIDVSYKLPFTSPGTFSGKLLQTAEQTMLAVPRGVEVKAEGMEEAGKEPRTQATVFKITAKSFKLEMTGTGELQPAAGAAGGEGGEENGPSISQIDAKIYDRKYWVMGLTLGVLLLGFVLMYRAEPVKGKKG